MTHSTPFPRPVRPVSMAERLHTAPPPATRPPTPNFLTIAEIALRLRVSKMTIYRLYHEGLLKGSVRVGRSIRVPETGVDSLLRAGTDVAGAIEGLRQTAVND